MTINATTGEIAVRSTFDREVSPTERVLVYAIDNGSISRTSTATVEIAISDIDDETARFTQTWYVYFNVVSRVFRVINRVRDRLHGI